MKGRLLLKLGIAGTVLTCVACFTPAAVAVLGLLGLARWTGYLDYVLLPLLALFLVLLGYGWRRRRWGARLAKAPREGTAWQNR